MAKINNLNDFEDFTRNISFFSHAYLFNVNSLEKALFYAKEFAKMIILQDVNYLLEEKESIEYQIDNDEFDDLYIVNPSSIGINSEEINKLLSYMETKSLRENGRRVYIIYGFERLSRDMSNKILKFLEEPQDNIYAILLTMNVDKILPTIISRCQVFNMTFEENEANEEIIKIMKKFLSNIIDNKNKSIADENEFFADVIGDRNEFYEMFSTLEKILSVTINYKYNSGENDIYIHSDILDYPTEVLVEILKLTVDMKKLIKNNINLNLLLDRYIIEVVEVFDCAKSCGCLI